MLKPITEWDEAFLQNLVGTAEGIDIDFKNEGSLDKRKPDRNAELCKDVSCFANADGGVVLYGMDEKKGGGRDAVGIADALTGCDPNVINVDDIYQILNGGVEARLEGLFVKRIPLSSGRVAFAVEVQQAKSFAPHQVRERGVYYCRHGSQILAMYDHQVRDVMRRSANPIVYGQFEFNHIVGDEFLCQFKMGNRSDVPATHLLMEVILESYLADDPQFAGFDPKPAGLAYLGRPLSKLGTVYGASDLPLFKGYEKKVLTRRFSLPPNQSMMFGYHLACPGSIVRSLQTVVRLTSTELVVTETPWPI